MLVGQLSFLSLYQWLLGGYYQHKTELSLAQTNTTPLLKLPRCSVFTTLCGQPYVGHRSTRHGQPRVPLSASTFHFIIHQLLVFLLASNKSNDPKSKTSSCTIHISASSLHFHRSNYKCLFSILIVISFDRTHSPSLKAQTLHTILSSFSPSLAANRIACIRVSNSFKSSRANLRSCIVWGVISRLQEQESKHASPRDTRGWSLSVEWSSAPFPLLWGDTCLPALSPAQISFPFQCALLSETQVFPHSLFCPCPGPVASPEK